MQIYIMYSPDRILSIIEDRRRELGLSQAEVTERAFGQSGNSAIQNLKKGASPGFDRVEALAHALNLEVYFGPKRHAPGFSEGDMASDFGKQEALRAGYLPIPWHPRLGLKGSSPLAFAREWMLDRDLLPDNLSVVTIDRATVNNAMRGQLLAVIDGSSTRGGPPQPWAYMASGRVHLSDLEFRPTATIVHRYGDDGSTWLMMDSERDAINPLGRAVWFGGLSQ